MNISNKTDRIFDDESMELFKTLFDEFVPAFLKTAKGQKHFKTILQSRNEIQNNIEMVRKAYDQGEDITEMVLEKLLPHMDTEHNQVRGAWVHIAPAITKDIKIWFGNIPYYKEKQWSVMAKAVYHFILQCIEHPESLEQACKTFSELPDTKGIQSGFLSPALNALDPDNFITINQKPVRMINHFARTSYSSNLLDYPAINRVGLRMLAELTQMISPVTPQGLHNSDVFDMFSHWLKAVKKFWKGGDNSHSKYWQIAPGKQARLWEEFRNASIAAIGYQKMDFDLSGKSEQELYEIYCR